MSGQLVLLGGASLLMASTGLAASAQTVPPPAADDGTARTRLVILGDAGGRTAWRGLGEGGMSAAVRIGKDVYLVDFGAGWLDAFYQAKLGTPGDPSVPGGLETLRAGFITHLHADHVADYGRLVQFGPSDGLQRRKSPVEIYGPGRVARTESMSSGIRSPKTPVRPANPSPGTIDLTKSLLDAYAADINDNMSDGGKPHPDAYLGVHDIAVPAAAGASPSRPSPRMSPFQIYADENVRVLATLVDHAPLFPAFAFRFETPDGAIVFSGDTGRSDNLIELAKGADVLVHEAIDMSWPRKMLPEPRSAADEAKLRHLLEAHTDIAELGPLAQQAKVRTLVVSHLSPPTTSDQGYLSQIKGFDGTAVVGRRLFSLSLPLK